MGQAHAMVSLVEQGWANQIEVAAAFHQSVRTVRREQRRFEDGGLTALVSANGYPPGRARLPAARQELVHKLKAHGHSNCEIARRLGVSETAVRKSLRRLGWKDSSTQSQLPLEPAPSSTQTCPLFLLRPFLCAAGTPIRRIGDTIGCWLTGVCWKTRPRCSVPAPPFHGPA